MNTFESTNHTRSMASVCRRRDQLKNEGIRPETLAWAVAEASETAIELADHPGPDMVRQCLAEAQRPDTSGTECEALLIFAAAGVNRVRSELRTVGVPVPLTKSEAFREIRLAQRKAALSHAEMFEAIQVVGPSRVLEMAMDQRIPFSVALADEIVVASKEGDKPRVEALTQVGAFGVRELRRGLKVHVSTQVRAYGVVALAEIIADESPRRALRHQAAATDGDRAEELAALSFVQAGALKQAVGVATARCRDLALLEMGRARKTGVDSEAVYRAIQTVGAVHLMEVMDFGSNQSELRLAEEVVAAFEKGDSRRGRALISIGAFGVWRLHHGVKIDASDLVRDAGAEMIAEIIAGESPQQALRDRAREAEGEEAERLAALSFVDRRRLDRSAEKALHQRVATAFAVAEDRAGSSGQPLGANRVPGTQVAAVVGKDEARD
jgi:hypothetical protein